MADVAIECIIDMLAPGKRVYFFTVWLLFCLVLLCAGLIGAELILRFRQIQPWNASPAAIEVTPGGKLFSMHPLLGYAHLPGQFQITINGQYSFHVTHLPNSLRITRPLDTYQEGEQRPEIWIFGCSYTYGWPLNDEDTYPWLLQSRFPDMNVVNFGVNGYGTIHSLIQFQEALKTSKPALVILAYAPFHDYRNTLLRARKKELASWNHLGPLVQPFARFDPSDRLNYGIASPDFVEFPLMRRSSLAHFIEQQYDYWEGYFSRSHQVTEKLILQMAEAASRESIPFIIAGISSGQETASLMALADRRRIPAVDISVDLEKEGNSCAPYDLTHPGKRATRLYADRLEPVIREHLAASPPRNFGKGRS